MMAFVPGGNDNEQVTEERSSRWPGPVRWLADFVGQAEERPAPSRAARATDAAIAAGGTVAAVVVTVVHALQSGSSRLVYPQLPGYLFPKPPGYHVVQFGHGTSPAVWVLLGVGLTVAPLAFRRIYPISAFCVILAAVIATRAEASSITFAAVIFAAYSAVAYSEFRRLALFSVLAGGVIVTAAYPNTTPSVPERFTALLVLLPTVSVAIAIRIWRRRARESAERLRRAEAEHEAETRRAVALERARIASEMHDVVTHNVSVMVVQAGAARRVLDSSPDDAREALLAVEASGRTAMTELRHLLGLLAPAGEGDGDAAAPAVAEGAEDATLTPQPGMARIPALVKRLCEAGMPVELSVEAPAGTRRDLPPGVDLAAFRVVQEALTNVMKHAGAVRTTVRLEYRPRDLLITVCNDSPPPGSAPAAAAGSSGRGLIGLRERLAVYGGEIDAGPYLGGGWRVAARIPLEPAAGDLPVPPSFETAST
jgi:signal transduction histidine kinase